MNLNYKFLPSFVSIVAKRMFALYVKESNEPLNECSTGDVGTCCWGVVKGIGFANWFFGSLKFNQKMFTHICHSPCVFHWSAEAAMND